MRQRVDGGVGLASASVAGEDEDPHPRVAQEGDDGVGSGLATVVALDGRTDRRAVGDLQDEVFVADAGEAQAVGSALALVGRDDDRGRLGLGLRFECVVDRDAALDADSVPRVVADGLEVGHGGSFQGLDCCQTSSSCSCA